MEIIKVIENEIDKYSDKWIETKSEKDFEFVTTLCKLYTLYSKENKENEKN